MDISAIVSNGNQTEENLIMISATLNNLASIIESKNVVVDETVSCDVLRGCMYMSFGLFNPQTLESVSGSAAALSINWPAEILENSTSSSLE